VHLILNESNHFNIVDLLDSSLQLLQDNVKFNIVLISGSYQVAEKERRNKLAKSLVHVKYVRTEYDKSEYLFSKQLPRKTDASHDQKQWIEFFTSLEPLREQCLTVGSRLVAALSDIRVVDAQGTTTRRQLHSQHRALSRALMDTELQSIRRKGPNSIARLQERAARINTDNNNKSTLNETKNQTTIQTEIAGLTSLNVDNNLNTLLATTTASTTIITATTNLSTLPSHENDFVETRLNSVIMLFNEVDRSAKRLEQITEQRRERLREMTRQRALEDEINEVNY
jgi:pleckstrin homology domain-containing family G member 4